MKLAPFISGVFGVVGFGLSILAGLAASNTVESILQHALFSTVICYAVGYMVGLIAQQVAQEHAQHLAKRVAKQDEREESTRLEEQAKSDAEIAAAGAVDQTPATVALPGNR